MKPGTRWIMVIVSLLAFNVLAAVVLAACANDSHRSRVLPTYKFEAK